MMSRIATKLYLAGPMSGLTLRECSVWRKKVSEKLSPLGYQCVSPCRGKNRIGSSVITAEPNPQVSDHEIVRRDLSDVSRCDCILANLMWGEQMDVGQDRVSIGTMFELAWAAQQQKFIVVIMHEENVHNHPFVREAAGLVVPTLDEAIDYFANTYNVEGA